jgi:thymidylate synthase (FAD)
MKAPVPIRTQCFKHKQGFVENEESRRYIESEPELFIPESFRKAPEGNKKQGSEGVHPDSDTLLMAYQQVCDLSIMLYNKMISEKVAPEQARLVLPQGVYVNWIWTGSLAAFARFYKQRIDSHAQKEIQDLAKEVGSIIEPLFPVSWKALTNAGK